METPNFKHDCEKCVFLGKHLFRDNFTVGVDPDIVRVCDLYVCPQEGSPTVIVRFSDDGADYKSGLTNVHICIKEAEKRAFDAGILKIAFDKDAVDDYSVRNFIFTEEQK